MDSVPLSLNHLIDSTSIETFLISLIDEDGDESHWAIYDICKEYHPSIFAMQLIRLLRESSSSDVRSAAAVVLRWLFEDGKITGIDQRLMQSALLNSLVKEQCRPVLNKIRELVTVVASRVFLVGGWPEFVDVISGIFLSDDWRHVEASMVILHDLDVDAQVYLWRQLSSSLDDWHFTALLNTFVLGPFEIQPIAFKFVVRSIHVFSSEQLELILQGMTASVVRMLEGDVEDATYNCILSMTSLFLEMPNTFSRVFYYVIEVMVSVIEQSKSKDTRLCASDLLISLANIGHQYGGYLFDDMVERLVSMLMSLEEPSRLGQLSAAVGGHRVFLIVSQFLPEYLCAPDWQQRRMGILFLNELAIRYLHGTFNELKNIVSIFLCLFDDEELKVREAAFCAVGDLSNIGSLKLQSQFHDIILPALETAIVQKRGNGDQGEMARTALAMYFFVQNCSSDILAIHLDGIACTLLVLLQENDVMRNRNAFCIFNAVALQCNEAVLIYHDTFLPKLLIALNVEHPDTLEEATRGVGLCAEFGGSLFQPFVDVALTKLVAILAVPGCRGHDIAVSALGKLWKFHRPFVNADQVIPTWLEHLPLRCDLNEAKLVHEQLCSMVERLDEDLLGHNGQHLRKIIAVFTEVLRRKHELATGRTAYQMIELLKKFRDNVPYPIWADILLSLDCETQQTLKYFLFYL